MTDDARAQFDVLYYKGIRATYSTAYMLVDTVPFRVTSKAVKHVTRPFIVHQEPGLTYRSPSGKHHIR